MIRGILVTSLYLLSLPTILFCSAGRINWYMGWAAILVYSIISVIALFLADPDLVKERSRIVAGVKVRDVILASVSFISFFPITLMVAGMDYGRYGWSPPLPLAAQFISLLLFGFGNAIGCWAIVSNPFFSTFVRIQKDRDQKVITSGPYRFVRHPGYAGSILAALMLPVALGSLWALIPALAGAIGFAIRTAVEDKTLIDELSGYRQYANRVVFRLFPGVW